MGWGLLNFLQTVHFMGWGEELDGVGLLKKEKVFLFFSCCLVLYVRECCTLLSSQEFFTTLPFTTFYNYIYIYVFL